MSNVLRSAGLIVVATLAACSGSPTADEDIEKQAFDDLREEVRTVVEDPEREAVVVALVDSMEEQFAVLRDSAATRRQVLQDLNADYDATREQFVEFLGIHNAELRRGQQAFLESHRELVEATTAEEWAALEKTDTKSMKRLADAMAAI